MPKVFPLRVAAEYALAAALLASICFLLGRVAMRQADALAVPAASESGDAGTRTAPLLVLDPGHGGEDGGAAVGGALEKELNLAVSLRVADLCTLFGLPVRMTRTEDVLLYDYYHDLEDYRGKQKTYDLKNRVRMAEESGAAALLSIHMNQFPQSSCRGLQVYYSPNTGASAELAERIRQSARLRLDPDNRRETKEATDAIYLLKRIRIPAVLAECGFLSNPEERELLSSPDYQGRLSAALFIPTAEFLTGGK